MWLVVTIIGSTALENQATLVTYYLSTLSKSWSIFYSLTLPITIPMT